MKTLIAITLCITWIGSVLAENMTTPSEAFNAGQAFANQAHVVSGGTINDTTGSKNLPHYATKAPETTHFQDGRHLISGAGTQKQTGCQSERAVNAFQQQECDAVNFLSKNPSQRPRFTLDKKNDLILTGSQRIINDPGHIPGTHNQQCRVEKIKHPATFTTETCTETMTLANLSCSRVLRVACDPERDGCDQGGIVPNSWAGDMSTSFTPDGTGNYTLQFGTIADNYWSGWGAVYDRTLTFELRDVGLISKFVLTRVAYDDWLLIKINGTIVYVGPYGGDRLGMWVQHYKRVVRYCESCFSHPELSTSWNISLNLDIKPHLKNGSNTLFMRTIVAGKGEGAIQITTRQQCPRNCYDQWDSSQCAPLEARSR